MLTDWSQGSLVKISGPVKGDPVFFTATTGHEWVITLRFEVPRNAFKQSTLEGMLGLAPFHQSPTPVLSDHPRVTVAETAGGAFQEVIITAHSISASRWTTRSSGPSCRGRLRPEDRSAGPVDDQRHGDVSEGSVPCPIPAPAERVEGGLIGLPGWRRPRRSL